MTSLRSPLRLFALVLLLLLSAGPRAGATVSTVGNAMPLPDLGNVNGLKLSGIRVNVGEESRLVSFGSFCSGGGTTGRFGLYRADGQFAGPGSLVAQSANFTVVDGANEVVPTETTLLPVGDYWVVAVYNGLTGVRTEVNNPAPVPQVFGRSNVDPAAALEGSFPGPSPFLLYNQPKINHYLKLAAAPTPTLTKPASISANKNPVAVDYTLPQAAVAGSVQLIFDDGVTTHALTLAGEGAANYAFTFDPANPVASSGGGITSGVAIPDGFYTATLRYAEATDGGPGATGWYLLIDTTKPVLTVPEDFTIEATASNGASAYLSATATDAISTQIFVATNPVSGSILPLGTTTVQATATDAAGNQATGSFKVTVVDTTAPTATVPALITVPADNTGHANPVGIAAQLTDVHDAVTATANIAITQSIPENAYLAVGTYPITFTLTDSQGNHTDYPTTLRIAFDLVVNLVIDASWLAGPVVKGAALGDPVPDALGLGLADGASFATFFTPAIADTRDMAARVTIQSGAKRLSAIYRVNGAGESSIVALQGAPAAGLAAGVNYQSLLDPLLSPDGKIVILGKVSGGGVKPTADEVLWSNLFTSDGSLEVVLQEGSEVGIGSGINLKKIVSTSAGIGELVCFVSLVGPEVTAKTNQAIIRITFDPQTQTRTTTKLLRTGDEKLELSLDKVLNISAFVPVSAAPGQGNTHGAAGVVARVKSVTYGESLCLIRNDTTFIRLAGTKTPIGFLNNAPPTKIYPPSIMGPGVVGRLTGKFVPGKTCDIIDYYDGAGQRFVMLPGDLLPNQSTAFKTFSDPVGNSGITTLFRATLSGLDAKAPADTGLYAMTFKPGVDADLVREVVRGGAAATDANGDVIAGATFKKFLNYALPENGGALFTAELAGKEADGKAFTATSRLGLWAEDRTTPGKLRLLLRGGQIIRVLDQTPSTPPPVFISKTLSTFRLLDSLPGSFGSRRSYSSNGSVAVLATFTDKTQAIVRVDIP